MQFFFVVDVPVVQVHLGVQSGTRSLTCPLLSTTGFYTVKVPQMWIFQLCNTDGYDASSIFGYGGDEGIFDAFCVIFRAPPVVPELSASFWSPRWPTVVGHRGLPMPISTGLCGKTHFLASDRVSNNNNNNKLERLGFVLGLVAMRGVGAHHTGDELN